VCAHPQLCSWVVLMRCVFTRKLKNVASELEPEKETKVGKLYFDPRQGCKPDRCYVGLPTSTTGMANMALEQVIAAFTVCCIKSGFHDHCYTSFWCIMVQIYLAIGRKVKIFLGFSINVPVPDSKSISLCLSWPVPPTSLKSTRF